jgi:hypothetical protein
MDLLEDALHDGCCRAERGNELPDNLAAVQPPQLTCGCLQLCNDIDGGLRVQQGGRS